MRNRRVLILSLVLLVLVAAGLVFAAGDRNYKGITIRITVNQAGKDGAISGPLYRAAEIWEKQTGGKVEIIEIPYTQHYTKLMQDLITGAGQFDAAIIGSWWLGDLVAGNYLVPIDQFYNKGTHPYWDKDWLPPSLQVLHKWGNVWYGVPNDSDGQVLYYRYDVLTNPEYRKKFKEKYGYDLPVPPKTWKQVLDIARFFTGWDWNGDGKPDYGFVMHLKVGGQGMFHFMSLSAPFVINPENSKLYWFDPITMKPLITSPGHKKALEFLLELVKTGPKAQVSWDLGEAWDFFLRGNAVMTFSWGDVGSLAQDPKRSKIRGKLGVSVLPGTLESYDLIHEKWVKFSEDNPNVVGNTTGGSWHGVILRSSKHPEAVYDFLSLMATKDFSLWNVANGWTGVDPGWKIHFIRPVGVASIREYMRYGWDPGDIVDYLAAYYDNFYAKLIFPYLMIPGAYEYWYSMDIHLSEAVTGQKTVDEALKAIYKDWEDTTDSYGRKKLLKLYRESIGWTKKDDEVYLKYHPELKKYYNKYVGK